MPYILRPATPGDSASFSALGAALASPRGLTEKDLFVYPASEIWIAEHGGGPVAAARLCYSELSSQALVTDLGGDAKALKPLVAELTRVAEGRGAASVEGAAPLDSDAATVLAHSGMLPYRRVVELGWQLPAKPSGEAPERYGFMEELPDPDLYARLAVAAYHGSWDWLFDRWGGDIAARRNFARLLESPRGESFIAARREGQLLGFVSYGATDVVPGDWSTFGVLVHPDARGHGVGHHLLALALERLAATGRQTLYMHTTAPVLGDAPAVRLYLQSGAVRREDTLVLRRPVN